MLNSLSHSFVEIAQGTLAIWDSKPKAKAQEPTILFIHGHTANKDFFTKQLTSPLFNKYRLIAVDLPGHGKSSPPNNPKETYSFPGYANSVAALVHLMKLENIVVVGWSLGGHVALELTSRLPQLKGLLITGTPPIEISPEGFNQGFKAASPEIAKCFGKGNLTYEEAELFGTLSGYDYSEKTKFIVEAILQTDEGAKTIYPQSILDGVGQNELAIVKEWPHPIAVIAGQEEAAVNNDYIMHKVHFNNLWEDTVHCIAHAGHGVFMEQPDAFNQIMHRFISDIFIPNTCLIRLT
ncbi:MAG: alpha/beta hydrolase [Verrucomicrobia bacterium]|nr:alpha/beta hydrolase [Verrucomicrobiota bacterium]